MTIAVNQRAGLTDVTNVTVNQRQKNLKPTAQAQNIPESKKRKSDTKNLDNRPAPAFRYSCGGLLHSIDSQNEKNELYCAEYSRSIFRSMKSREHVYQASPEYMKNQTDITSSMRATLIDWLVEVHFKFKMEQETLFLCVNLVDRYLEKIPVSRGTLQLVGVTCMLVAAKYEEIYPPEICDFCEITDNSYTRDEVMKMELKILNELEFNLTVPSSAGFLRRYLEFNGASNGDLRWNVAVFLLELCLQEYSSLKWTPTVLASSALYLCNRLHEVSGLREAPSWESSMEQYTGYTEKQIRECTKELLNNLCQISSRSCSHVAVKRKYTKLNQGQVIYSAPVQKVLRSSS
jgi:cyclin B